MVAAATAGNVAGSVVGSALSSLFGGSTPPSVSSVPGNANVNVQPVGVNLGEILKNFNEGSRTNGGFGLSRTSRFLEGDSALSLGGDIRANVPSLLVALGALGALFFLVRRRGSS